MNQIKSVGLRGDNEDYQTIFGMEVSIDISNKSSFGRSLSGNSNVFLIEQVEIQEWCFDRKNQL